MQTSLITIFLSAVLVDFVHGTCTGKDHKLCPKWIADGFCTSKKIPEASKKMHCGIGCGLCDGEGAYLKPETPEEYFASTPDPIDALPGDIYITDLIDDQFSHPVDGTTEPSIRADFGEIDSGELEAWKEAHKSFGIA